MMILIATLTAADNRALSFCIGLMLGALPLLIGN